MSVGHRALVARERPDGCHDVHYSQWGGADLSLAHALANDPWPPHGVAADPLTTGVAWSDLAGTHLDALVHEALYVVEADGAVRAYRTCWLGVTGGGSDGGGAGVAGADDEEPAGEESDDEVSDAAGSNGEGPDGLLVGVRWADHCDDVRVRAWFRGARAVAARATETGAARDPAAAATLVERCLREWAADREVLRIP